jgi:hypothetical protein
MTPTAQEPRPRSIDVTGLAEDTIRAIEALISALRGQAGGTTQPPFSSYPEWSKAFREWVAGHPPRETSADWSRESAYVGRGE